MKKRSKTEVISLDSGRCSLAFFKGMNISKLRATNYVKDFIQLVGLDQAKLFIEFYRQVR